MKKTTLTPHINKVFFLILISTLTLFATIDGPNYWKVRNVNSDDTLNIRDTYSYKSAKIGSLSFDDDCIKILEHHSVSKRSIWAHIKYKGINGWVNSKFLIGSNNDKCYPNTEPLRITAKPIRASSVNKRKNLEIIHKQWAIERPDIVLKNNLDSCTISYNEEKLSSEDCLRTINSNNMKILCTRNKQICVTENEVINFVNFELKKFKQLLHIERIADEKKFYLSKERCLKGDSQACTYTGNVYIGDGLRLSASYVPTDGHDLKKAVYYLKKGCNGNDAKACVLLGDIFSGLHNEVEDNIVDEDIKLSISFYKKACELKSSEGCYNAGNIYSDYKDKESAFIYFKSSCKLGNNNACILIKNIEKKRKKEKYQSMSYQDKYKLYLRKLNDAQEDYNKCTNIAPWLTSSSNTPTLLNACLHKFEKTQYNLNKQLLE